MRGCLTILLCAAAASASGQSATIVDLQPFRQTQTIRIQSSAQREGAATLTNLNPGINVWYLLEVSWKGAAPARAYHLENPAPLDQTLRLDQQHPSGVVVARGSTRYACDLFSSGPPDLLEKARASPAIFAPLCESRIYLRNAAVGHRTTLEAATEFVRDHIWGGETVIGLGHQVMSDANRQTGALDADARAASAARAENTGPSQALVDPAFADRMLEAQGLGIGAAGASAGRMAPGVWYATAVPGSYVSVLEPEVISAGILKSRTPSLPLDSVEASALCYLIAFDLDQFNLRYARGTVHPEVGWSDHITARMRDSRLPGPDGIGGVAPIVSTGLVPPFDVGRTVGAFTAGFKRAHGAFLWGDFSLVNHGTHYGFIENGVVFSRLQTGLSTVIVLDDGRMDMKTWKDADNALLPHVRYARQNGVPVVETDAAGATVPGRLIAAWGAGNWSGSQDRKLRTMRSGLAVQVAGGKRYLIYAVFSSATPSAMARVFQAYRCQYAMLLDMNALEHTYFALYRSDGQKTVATYLVQGMREVDPPAKGSKPVVRFIGYPDNRDFFYLMRRDESGGRP